MEVNGHLMSFGDEVTLVLLVAPVLFLVLHLVARSYGLYLKARIRLATWRQPAGAHPPSPREGSGAGERTLLFDQLPPAVRKIIGTWQRSPHPRLPRYMTLQEVWWFQRAASGIGRLQYGIDSLMLMRAHFMARRRIVRVLKALQVSEAHRGIVEQYPLISVTAEGDVVLRKLPLGQPAPGSPRDRVTGGISASDWIEGRVYAALDLKAARLAANRALAREVRSRGVRIDRHVLTAEYWRNRCAIGFRGGGALSNARRITAAAPRLGRSLARQEARRRLRQEVATGEDVVETPEAPVAVRRPARECTLRGLPAWLLDLVSRTRRDWPDSPG